MDIKNCTNDQDPILYTSLNELDKEDIVVFKYGKSSVCMSKSELFKSWADQYSSWKWGNCKDMDGNSIDRNLLYDDDSYRQYCTKYYRLPHNSLYITEAMKESLVNSNIQIWTITKSGEKRSLFRGYSNEIEEDIYKICPEDDKDCNFIEDINRFNYDPIAAIQSLSPDEIFTLYNNLTMDDPTLDPTLDPNIDESYDALRALAVFDPTLDPNMDESYDALRALADINDTEDDSLRALEALAVFDQIIDNPDMDESYDSLRALADLADFDN